MTNDEMYKRVIVMTSIKTAKGFITTYDISKRDLGKLCKKFNIFVESKATKEEMIDRFLAETLGKKLRNKVINKHNTR